MPHILHPDLFLHHPRFKVLCLLQTQHEAHLWTCTLITGDSRLVPALRTETGMCCPNRGISGTAFIFARVIWKCEAGVIWQEMQIQLPDRALGTKALGACLSVTLLLKYYRLAGKCYYSSWVDWKSMEKDFGVLFPTNGSTKLGLIVCKLPPAERGTTELWTALTSHRAVGMRNIPNLVLLSTLALSKTKRFLAEVAKVTNMVGINLYVILDADEKFSVLWWGYMRQTDGHSQVHSGHEGLNPPGASPDQQETLTVAEDPVFTSRTTAFCVAACLSKRSVGRSRQFSFCQRPSVPQTF